MSMFARYGPAALFKQARPLLRVPAAVDARRRAPFHSTARVSVSVGDRLPNVELQEGSPGNKVNLSKDIRGKALVIGERSIAFPLLPNSLRPRSPIVGTLCLLLRRVTF